jgi:origin recognition complex subunit 1
MPRENKWLTKGALSRDDSDDELGYEDHPWQWVYDDKATEDHIQTPSKKRKANAMDGSTYTMKDVVGASMGSFSVKLGDAVLLKSPEQGTVWVGLICDFSERDEDGDEEMCANIQWFCSPHELEMGNRKKKMPETIPNESFITGDFNWNPLTAINGKATVLSKDAFLKKYPDGKRPKSKSQAAQYAKTIMCRRGVKQRTFTFTEEFVWQDHYSGPDDLLPLLDWIQDQTKTRRRTKVKPEDDDGTGLYTLQEEPTDAFPTTPKKRRKTTSTTTPKSTPKRTFITPTNKRIQIKAPLEITPLGTRILSAFNTPYSHARTTLHVSAVPTSLPCRQHEFNTVYNHLYSAIADGSGSCIYISGVPGTGKTATVREVISSLHQAVLADELDDFNFVEINGMKVTEPHQSYSLLWEALKGDRVSPSHALSLLEHEFSHPSPRRIPCVVLMDELDQLVTRNQSVMYNFFNWPALRHSRLIVLAVANTMDLPERTLSNKISSRLGLTRITFPGYTHTQLMEIITSRLEGVPGNIVDADAIQFAARKVAAVSGDARRALDICRRAVEIAEAAAHSSSSQINDLEGTPTKSRKLLNKTTPHQQPKEKRLARVTIPTIKLAISEATSSPLHHHLRSLPLASKLFLASLLSLIRRTGVSDHTLADILSEAKKIANQNTDSSGAGALLTGARVAGIGSAAGELSESGIVNVEIKRMGERGGRARLRVGVEEVRGALGGEGDCRGLGISA